MNKNNVFIHQLQRLMFYRKQKGMQIKSPNTLF